MSNYLFIDILHDAYTFGDSIFLKVNKNLQHRVDDGPTNYRNPRNPHD